MCLCFTAYIPNNLNTCYYYLGIYQRDVRNLPGRMIQELHVFFMSQYTLVCIA